MQRLKVFVVEDNAIELDGFIAMLKELDCLVVGSAANGKDAVELLTRQETEVDVILMDINLPKLNGLSAAQQIGEKSDTPIIFITGYKPDRKLISETARNVYGYVQKPVGIDELEANLRIAYHQSQELKKTTQDLAKAKKNLEDRKLVEQAKGIIMRMNGCTEPEALAKLQKRSRDENRKISEVAKEIVLLADKLRM